MCEQWRYWWDCPFVEACLNLHCSYLVGQEIYFLAWHCYFLFLSSKGIGETVHLCRLVRIFIAATQWARDVVWLSMCQQWRLYICAGLSEWYCVDQITLLCVYIEWWIRSSNSNTDCSKYPLIQIKVWTVDSHKMAFYELFNHHWVETYTGYCSKMSRGLHWIRKKNTQRR